MNIRPNVYSPKARLDDYVRGTLALKKRGIYDEFVRTHFTVMNFVHGSPLFLPWHRAFVSDFERALQQELGDPTFAIPYWDWTDDASRPNQVGPLWDASKLGRPLVLGSSNPVTSGPFVGAAWVTIDAGKSNFGPRLMRQLSGQDYTTRPMVHALFVHAAFDDFREALEFGPHGAMHIWVGGQMSSVPTSVNDPVFWLHHANVDRVFAQWQLIYPTAIIKAPDTALVKNFGPNTKMPPTRGQTGALLVKQVWNSVGVEFDYDQHYTIQDFKVRFATASSTGAGTNAQVSVVVQLQRPGTKSVAASWGVILRDAADDHSDPFEADQVDTFTYPNPSFSDNNGHTPRGLVTPAALSAMNLTLRDNGTWFSDWVLSRVQVLAEGGISDSGSINETVELGKHVLIKLQAPQFPKPPAPRAFVPGPDGGYTAVPADTLPPVAAAPLDTDVPQLEAGT